MNPLWTHIRVKPALSLEAAESLAAVLNGTGNCSDRRRLRGFSRELGRVLRPVATEIARIEQQYLAAGMKWA